MDRSKYKPVSSDELKEQKERVADFLPQNEGRAGFLSIDSGINTFRIYPAQMKAEKRNFLWPKVVNWLPSLIEAKDKAGKPLLDKSGHQTYEVKKRPVFNSRAHGGAPKDIIEEYIKFAHKLYSEEIQDENELNKKLHVLLDWQDGIKAKTSWVVYADKYLPDGTKIFGRLELTNGVREQLNSLSERQGAESQPLYVDIFSDPDNGKAIQLKYNKGSEDKRKTYEVSVIFEKDWAISDEDLGKFEELESLEELYGPTAFKVQDFVTQLESLEYLDRVEGFSILKHDEFVTILNEISTYFPEEEAGADKEEKSSTTTVAPENAEEYSDKLDEVTDKAVLKKFVSFHKLPVEIKLVTSLDGAKESIREAVAEANKIEDMEVLKTKINSMLKEFASSDLPFDKPTGKTDEKKVSAPNSLKGVSAGRSAISALKYKYKQP